MLLYADTVVMMLHFSMPRSVLTRSMRSSQPWRC